MIKNIEFVDAFIGKTKAGSHSFSLDDPLVSIVVLNYNGEKLLRNCLSSVSKTKYRNFEVIVVDNGSKDGSCSMVEREFPFFQLIKNPKNYGYSKGNNLGIIGCKGKFVAMLNNDTTVNADWLSALVKEANRNPACFYQPKILIEDTNRINSTGNCIQPFGFAFPRGLGEIDKGQYCTKSKISYASGACVFCSRALIEDVGFLDEAFYSFYEDVNWGWRALMRAHETIYVPSAVIYHKWGGSWGQTMSRKKFFLIERSRIMSVLRNYSSKTIVFLLPGLICTELAVFLYSLLNGFFPEKVHVYADLLKLRKLLMNQRKELQARRMVPDKYVFRYFNHGLNHLYLGALSRPADKLLSFLTKISIFAFA
jgi:GT2 family glycosyltransferase